ncbi:hypothetical protein [Mycobacterium sp. SMC-4]|uniref:hypothetical protein n=1 Tax=Mycobacterium sp. SMC-4 TaxID=2857059 RepID=UPI003D03C256
MTDFKNPSAAPAFADGYDERPDPDVPAGASASDVPEVVGKNARHRRPSLLERWLEPLHQAEPITAHSQTARSQVLAGSVLGVGCLLLAHWTQPEPGALFSLPTNPVAWLTLACGIIGIWLVPGLWLCALLVRTGGGPAAWLGSRIATTLAWYAMAGPAIHFMGEGARVTATGIIIATVAATSAVCAGVVLGLSRRPRRLWQRALVSAIIGAICTQAAISAWMHIFSFGMNYSHIRRLDWILVVGCALLTMLGALSRPRLPRVFVRRNVGKLAVAVAVLVSTFVVVAATGAKWSPSQQMPSAFGIEQVATRPGYDLAFGMTAIGPGGAQLVRDAEFKAADSIGRAISIDSRLDVAESGERATLLVTVHDESRPALCERHAVATGTDIPLRVTVRDQLTGVLVQGILPTGWCAQ